MSCEGETGEGAFERPRLGAFAGGSFAPDLEEAVLRFVSVFAGLLSSPTGLLSWALETSCLISSFVSSFVEVAFVIFFGGILIVNSRYGSTTE
jgi:hypothetical protein